jgi:hypothetical protein
MGTQNWRSSETIERLKRLERPDFAIEFLRRNANYRRDYANTFRQIERGGVDADDAHADLASRWGLRFCHDPNVPAGLEPAIWLPEHAPGTLILASAPVGFPVSVSFDANALGTLVATRSNDNGQEIVVADASGELHIWVPDNIETRHAAILMPLDTIFELRIDVTLRAVRRLHGQAVELLPSALRLTAYQRTRLVQLLHAFDVHEEGGGPREIASEVLASGQALLPSVEWKDSAARRHANRLIQESLALVNGGYLRLLSGK